MLTVLLTACVWWENQLRNQIRIIRLLLIAFVVGIFVSPVFNYDTFIVFCCVLGCIVLGLIFSHRSIRVVLLIVACVLLGVWRYQVSTSQEYGADDIRFYYDQKVVWEGVVVRAQQRIDQQKLVVEAQKRIDGSVDVSRVSGRVLVSTALWPQFQYGDVIHIECTLRQPKNFDDFDYEQYLAKDDIYTLCNFANIEKIAFDPPNSVLAIIHKFRTYLQFRLYQTLSEPQVSIVDGMILGNAYGIPKDVNALFSALGLTHIIAISGSHIVIMVSLCMWLAISCHLRRQQAFLLALGFVVVYIILVGAPPSAVRAGIMGMVVLLARQISRRHQPLHTLLVAAVFMLMVNPKLLAWDIGFQLSFAAVFGLLVVAPLFERWWSSLPNIFDVRTMLSMTVAAQLATLPIIIFHFKQISPWSILANFLILPIVPFLTIYALVHMLVSGLSVFVGTVLGWGSWVLVSYWLLVAQIVSRAPLVTIFFDGVWIWIGCAASFALLVFFVIGYRRYPTSRDILPDI